MKFSVNLNCQGKKGIELMEKGTAMLAETRMWINWETCYMYKEANLPAKYILLNSTIWFIISLENAECHIGEHKCAQCQ